MVCASEIIQLVKYVNVYLVTLDQCANQQHVNNIDVHFLFDILKCSKNFILDNNFNPAQIACSQSLCQNGGTCQIQGLSAVCLCKPGFTGQRCEIGSSSFVNTIR